MHVGASERETLSRFQLEALVIDPDTERSRQHILELIAIMVIRAPAAGTGRKLEEMELDGSFVSGQEGDADTRIPHGDHFGLA